MILFLDCNICGYDTPHEEVVVADSESATIWRCVFCGYRRRPKEPGNPNQTSKLPFHPFRPNDNLALSIPRGH